jgi:hypothetical protein
MCKKCKDEALRMEWLVRDHDLLLLIEDRLERWFSENNWDYVSLPLKEQGLYGENGVTFWDQVYIGTKADDHRLFLVQGKTDISNEDFFEKQQKSEVLTSRRDTLEQRQQAFVIGQKPVTITWIVFCDTPRTDLTFHPNTWLAVCNLDDKSCTVTEYLQDTPRKKILPYIGPTIEQDVSLLQCPYGDPCDLRWVNDKSMTLSDTSDFVEHGSVALTNCTTYFCEENHQVYFKTQLSVHVGCGNENKLTLIHTTGKKSVIDNTYGITHFNKNNNNTLSIENAIITIIDV